MPSAKAVISVRRSSVKEDSAVVRAVAGDSSALGELLQIYRTRLRNMAATKLGSRIRQRYDESDIVQLTYYEAYRDLNSFRGRTRPAFFCWLRQILIRNICNTVRSHRCLKRSVDREVPSQDWALMLGGPAKTGDSLASQPEVELEQQEVHGQLHTALLQLPHDQREAVRLRHLEGDSVRTVASKLRRSKPATAGLIKRGMKTLRVVMTDSNVATQPWAAENSNN